MLDFRIFHTCTVTTMEPLVFHAASNTLGPAYMTTLGTPVDPWLQGLSFQAYKTWELHEIPKVIGSQTKIPEVQI